MIGTGRIQSSQRYSIPPGTKTNTCRKNSWGINFSANACGACIRTRANTGKYLFEESFSAYSPNSWGKKNFGAYTCRACIRTRANTGNYSLGIIYVLVLCQGVSSFCQDIGVPSSWVSSWAMSGFTWFAETCYWFSDISFWMVACMRAICTSGFRAIIIPTPNPKGPSRTKNSTESKFSTGSKFATAVAKRYGECLEMLLFLGKEVGKRYREWKLRQ